MAKLSDDIKFFIVQGLACFDTPSQVAKAVKEEFAIDIPRSQVQLYDPTRLAGKSLSQKYRTIFEATRDRFLDEIKEIPIANQAFRLRALDMMYQRAISRGNDMLAKDVIEQAAKEANGFYTNKLKPSDDRENPLVALIKSIGNSSLPVIHDVEELAFDDKKESDRRDKSNTKKILLERD